MCITRVGKILSLHNSRASVKLFGDDRIVENVDVSMIDARPSSYVEIYANLALRSLSAKEAGQRKKAWVEVVRARG
jgi:hydrogenase maturation factor